MHDRPARRLVGRIVVLEPLAPGSWRTGANTEAKLRQLTPDRLR